MRWPSTSKRSTCRWASEPGSERARKPDKRLEDKAIVTTQTASRTLPDGSVGESFSVALEGIVYTLVDVHEGHDDNFERWYESDHFYAGGVLAPYVLSGTPLVRRQGTSGEPLRRRRLPAPESLALGTNLATYFLTTGGLVGFYDWIVPQLMTLRSSGRMFADRTHINTDGYRLESVLTFPGFIDRPGARGPRPSVRRSLRRLSRPRPGPRRRRLGRTAGGHARTQFPAELGSLDRRVHRRERKPTRHGVPLHRRAGAARARLPDRAACRHPRVRGRSQRSPRPPDRLDARSGAAGCSPSSPDRAITCRPCADRQPFSFEADPP